MTLSPHIKIPIKCMVVCLITITHINIYAQGTPTIFDCLGAKRICAQIYEESFVPRGVGNFTGEVNSNFSCIDDDESAIWYTFIVAESGDLGFHIIPNDVSDDYNWALFDITENDCRDIFTNPSMLVSCNSIGGNSCNGTTGADNSSTLSSQTGLCGSFDPNSTMATTAFNAFVPVEKNNIYALMISDVSGTSSGYLIDFSMSSNIMLQDYIEPTIKLLEPNRSVGCIPNTIFLQFSEYVKCESLSRANFKLMNEGGRSFEVDLDSGSCNLDGEYDRNFVLALLSPLPAGSTYRLEIEPSESEPIVDLCGNRFSSDSYTFEITTDELEEISLPTDTISCDNSITLDVFNPDATRYIWNDGSTSPAINIQTNGLYRVTVSNPCDQVQASINVIFKDDSNISFTLGRDTVICTDESFTLSANLNNPNYNYEWSDSLNTESRVVTKPGFYELVVTNECGSSFSSSIKVDFLNVSIDLPSDTTLCSGDVLTLNASHPNATIYQWSNGETTPTIQVSDGGLYSVEVINKCDTVIDDIEIQVSTCEDCQVYTPNVISSNSVGNNRYFFIDTSCPLESYHLQVYNRWGSLIFETKDQLNSWDTTDVTDLNVGSGIYIYQLQYSYYEDSILVSNQIQGDVLVIQ